MDPSPLRLTPHDPYPLNPHHATVVDGLHVTLRWAPADVKADSYRVQVAEDAAFERITLEQEVPATTTTLTVPRPFPDDDRTFYWRVLAGNAHGWSEGDHVESFTSGTAAEAGHFADPDEAEPFGPMALLVRPGGLRRWLRSFVQQPTK